MSIRYRVIKASASLQWRNSCPGIFLVYKTEKKLMNGKQIWISFDMISVQQLPGCWKFKGLGITDLTLILIPTHKSTVYSLCLLQWNSEGIGLFSERKSKWHDDERRINEAGKCIRGNTAFWTILRAAVRVQVCHVAVWLEFTFGRLGVTTQASWFAQVGRGILIGQRPRRLMKLTGESIGSPRARSDRLHACSDKRELALSW